MDVILAYVNDHIIDYYLPQPPQALAWFFVQDSIQRDMWVLSSIFMLGGVISEFLLATFTYWLIFYAIPDKTIPNKDRRVVKKGQIWREIRVSVWAMPTISFLTAPFYIAQKHGYSRLFYHFNDVSIGYHVASIIWFLLFTDCLIYWIHRWLHWGPLYKYIHQVHHSFLDPTPYGAFAFHPIDAWLQALPYHLFTFLFPLYNWSYLFLFVVVQMWTISIHDRVSVVGWGGIVNGSAHHALHHAFFKGNYGQYLTLWDKLGGTYFVVEDLDSALKKQL